MTTMTKYGQALAVIGALALGGCASTSPADNAYSSSPSRDYAAAQPAPAYNGYGVVQSIEVLKNYQGIAGTGFGLGTLAGAVIGGVVGHQVGSGDGNTAATAAGAAGGAYVGHQLEKRNQRPDAYALTIRMDGGAHQTLTQLSTGGLQVGNRVRVHNGVMQKL